MPTPAAAGGLAEFNLDPMRLAGRFTEQCQGGPLRRHRSGADTSELLGRSAALQTVLRQIDTSRERMRRSDALLNDAVRVAEKRLIRDRQ